MSSFTSNRLTSLKLGISFLALASLAYYLNIQVRVLGVSFVEPYLETQEKWNPTLIKALSFGQAPMTADWLWIRALQDPALSHVPEGKHAAIYFDFDLATDIDPLFFEAYMYGGNLLTVVRNDNIGARDLLEKGEKFRREELPKYPESFRTKYWKQGFWIPLTLGYIYLYELIDVPKAGIAFQEAAKVPGAPDYVKSLGEKLSTRDGQYTLAIRLVETFIPQNKDERLREGFVRKRKDLILGQYLYNLNEQFLGYLKLIPDYRKSVSVPRAKMEIYFSKFLRAKQIGGADPFGGRVYLDEGGKITSSTPCEKFFGFD